MEGDYIDTYIYGPKREIIGWIEYSGTKNGKMSAIKTIKYIELVASIISLGLQIGKQG